ncbi:MAG: UDP-4-amino-4,6-dideoxy-N-acetyl-beta-L-altrosamine transaminase [Mariprofundaceae bacterium]|nr:UDP-4-amino-4,6-dideoxy-N-acetyl-beta-L-altrosamine transaminase [Mariprofundaceae bacterium]
MIPYGKHFIDEDDIAAVVDVLRQGTLTQGARVDEFEACFASNVEAKYAIAVSSGTAALHLACMAADVKQGDNVITSANTFVASANCAAYVGASPQFTDIDPDTLNMSVQDLSSRCRGLKHVKAIIPVHFAGVACDMPAIKAIAEQYDAWVIEDACHALGGTYDSGEKIGSCQYSDMTVFSFHPVKAIAAGEGGMITTNSEELYQRLIQLRSHGIFYQKLLKEFKHIDADKAFVLKDEAYENGQINPWYFEMRELGYNYRLTEIQCTLAQSQLAKLDRFISCRKELASRYDEAFYGMANLTCVQTDQRERSGHHLYVVRIDFESLGMERGEFMRQLMQKGVGTQVHYIPVPLHPYYQSRGFTLSDYPETEKYYREALSLPFYYGLSDEEQNLVVQSIQSIVA